MAQKLMLVVLLFCFALTIQAGFIYKRDAPHALAAAYSSGRLPNTYLPARLQAQNDNSVSSHDSDSGSSDDDSVATSPVVSAPFVNSNEQDQQSKSELTELTDNDDESDTQSGGSASQVYGAPAKTVSATSQNGHSDSSSTKHSAAQVTNDYLPPATNYGTPVIANHHGSSQAGSLSASSTISAATNGQGNGHSSQEISQKYDSNGGYVY